jgi:hypothetical protein
MFCDLKSEWNKLLACSGVVLVSGYVQYIYILVHSCVGVKSDLDSQRKKNNEQLLRLLKAEFDHLTVRKGRYHNPFKMPVV